MQTAKPAGLIEKLIEQLDALDPPEKAPAVPFYTDSYISYKESDLLDFGVDFQPVDDFSEDDSQLSLSYSFPADTEPDHSVVDLSELIGKPPGTWVDSVSLISATDRYTRGK